MKNADDKERANFRHMFIVQFRLIVHFRSYKEAE